MHTMGSPIARALLLQYGPGRAFVAQCGNGRQEMVEKGLARKVAGENHMRIRTKIAVCLMALAMYGLAPRWTGRSAHAGYLYAAVSASNDAQIRAEIRKGLQGQKFKAVTVSVHNGTAVLSGEVGLYAYKLDAIRKAHKVPGVKGLMDNIAVGGPDLPDQVLQQKLLNKIEVDRVGYGQVFSAISVEVQNGVVTLGGHARGPVTKQSALALTQYMPGVKDVIDRIQVDPVSQFDDGIRLAVYNAIYNYAPLMEYADVPSRPIRISVQNQNVTLYGVVDNEMDKELIGIRANLVPNVFHVTNNLVVASQKKEK